VALKQDFRQQDTPLIFPVPKAGTYVLILRDLNYRGSASHTYRLTMGAIPYVTGVLPLGGPPGSTLHLQLTGVNLGSEASCRLTLPKDPLLEPFARALSLPNGLSNSILLTTDALPEQSRSGANFTLANAQTLPVPSVVNGRLYHPGTSAGAGEDDYRVHA